MKAGIIAELVLFIMELGAKAGGWQGSEGKWSASALAVNFAALPIYWRFFESSFGKAHPNCVS